MRWWQLSCRIEYSLSGVLRDCIAVKGVDDPLPKSTRGSATNECSRSSEASQSSAFPRFSLRSSAWKRCPMLERRCSPLLRGSLDALPVWSLLPSTRTGYTVISMETMLHAGEAVLASVVGQPRCTACLVPSPRISLCGHQHGYDDPSWRGGARLCCAALMLPI